jgi:hypothetical protein
MTLLLSTLAMISAVASGFFAAYGLVNDYKTPKGKLTRHGRIALIGIISTTLLTIISGFLSISISIKEEQRRELDRIALEKNNNDLISRLSWMTNDIRDQLMSLEGGQVTVVIRRILEGPIYESVAKRLREIVAAWQPHDFGTHRPGFFMDTDKILHWSGVKSGLTDCETCLTPMSPSLLVFPQRINTPSDIPPRFDLANFDFGLLEETEPKYYYEYSEGTNILTVTIAAKPVFLYGHVVPSLRSLAGRSVALAFCSIGEGDWLFQSLRFSTRNGLSLLSDSYFSTASVSKEIPVVVQMSSELWGFGKKSDQSPSPTSTPVATPMPNLPR